jgi:hypothetical protein
MIRLTVLYNLPAGANEEEYLEWRLGEHQQSNESQPGVLRTDFGRVDQVWNPDDPQASTPFRFMTIADWPDREAFEKAFFDPDFQRELKENLKKLADAQFLISEILASS